MHPRNILTKRDLIARLLHGPFTIERDALVLWYRLTLSGDREQKNAVIIALAPEFGFLRQEYNTDSAYAVVEEKILRLTRSEAEAIASRLRRTLRIYAETPAAR